MMYVAYCKAIGVTVGGGAAHDDGVKVVVYRKLCKIETLLLQATNRKWYMAYWIASFPMTSSDLKVIYFLQAFFNGIFHFGATPGVWHM